MRKKKFKTHLQLERKKEIKYFMCNLNKILMFFFDFGLLFLDKCGICEGRNDTCEDFTGNFYVSDLYKVQPKYKTYYYHVTTIPKGK